MLKWNMMHLYAVLYYLSYFIYLFTEQCNAMCTFISYVYLYKLIYVQTIWALWG